MCRRAAFLSAYFRTFLNSSPSILASRNDQRRSLVFTEDCLANGRQFRTANLKDDCTRECPAIEVDFSLPGRRVVTMLERVAKERGYPDMLVVDNGPELRGRELDRWAHDHGVKLC